MKKFSDIQTVKFLIVEVKVTLFYFQNKNLKKDIKFEL